MIFERELKGSHNLYILVLEGTLLKGLYKMSKIISRVICLFLGIFYMFGPQPENFVSGTGYIVGTIWIVGGIIIGTIPNKD